MLKSNLSTSPNKKEKKVIEKGFLTPGLFFFPEKKKGTEELGNNRKTINKMAISTYLSVTNLNVNGLSLPSKDMD